MKDLPTLVRIAAATLGIWCACVGAHAQQPALPDPTRPPPGFVGDIPAVGSTSGEAAAAASARSAAVLDDPAQSGLQSVLIPRHGKPVAIIGGKYVPLGERHGDYELVAVSETEVVLAKGKERKVMKLTPGAEKKSARPSSGDDRKAQARPVRAGATAGKAPSRKESETGR